MALGGGTWLTQNKKLPGTYINFTSKVRASVNMADRGYGAMALELDWGAGRHGLYRDQRRFPEGFHEIFRLRLQRRSGERSAGSL